MKIEVVYTCDCGVTTVTYTDALDEEMFIECFICHSRRFRLTPVAAEAASVTASEGDDTDRRPAEHDG